jgi:hypothetical protein
MTKIARNIGSYIIILFAVTTETLIALYSPKGMLKVLQLIIWGVINVYLIFTEVDAIKRRSQNEPLKDELTKKIRIKASSYAFYISIFWWMLIMFFGEKLDVNVTTIIVYGIAGMSLAFIFSWIGLRYFGAMND